MLDFIIAIAKGAFTTGLTKAYDKELSSISINARVELESFLNKWFSKITPKQRSNLENILNLATPELTVELRKNGDSSEIFNDQPINFSEIKPSVLGSTIEWVNLAKHIDPDSSPAVISSYVKALQELLKGNNAMVNALSELSALDLEELSKGQPIKMATAKRLEAMDLGVLKPPNRNFSLPIKQMLFLVAIPVTILVIIPYSVASTLFGMNAFFGFAISLFLPLAFLFYVHYVIEKKPYSHKNFIQKLWFEKHHAFWLTRKGKYVIYDMFGSAFVRNESGLEFLSSYIWVLHGPE